MGVGHVDVRAADTYAKPLLEGEKLDYVRLLSLSNVALDAVHLPEAEATQRLHDLGYHEVRYIRDDITDTVAVVASDGKEMLVSIRGFDSPKDGATAIRFTDVPSALGGNVGTGFKETLYGSSPPVIDQIHNAMQEVNHATGGGQDIHITSHSMGGALSSVMLAEMIAKPEAYPLVSQVKSLVGFGSIAPGDSNFRDALADATHAHGIESVSVINRNDVYMLMPPQHVSVGRQVIMQADGSTTVDADRWDRFTRLLELGGHRDHHLQGFMHDEIRARALAQLAHQSPDLLTSGAVSVAENTCLVPQPPSAQWGSESPERHSP